MLRLMPTTTSQTRQQMLASGPVLALMSIIAFMVELLAVALFPPLLLHRTRSHTHLPLLYLARLPVALSFSYRTISSSGSSRTPLSL